MARLVSITSISPRRFLRWPLRLLDAGKLAPARLAQWVRLDTGSPDGDAHPVKEKDLVGKYLVHEEIARALPDAKELRDPEILVKLANAGVPVSHAAALLFGVECGCLV